MSTQTASPAAAPAAPTVIGRVAEWMRTHTTSLPTWAALVIFVLMVGYAQFTYGNILQPSTISNLFINNSHLIIIAVALTIVIITGGIDLSVGAVIAFSSVAGVMLANAGWNPYLVIVLMIAFGATFGLISGLLIQYLNVQPFIATLAMMFLARGLASMLSTVPVHAPDDAPIHLLATDLKLIDGPKVNDLVLTPGFFIAVIIVVAAVFFLHRTRTGRTIYAIGGAESSAQLLGLRVARTRVLIYVISGALAGVAAVVYTAEVGGKAQNVTGIGWELDAIAAVVIGGTLLTGGVGYVLGSVVGSLVLAALWMIITKDGSIKPEYLTIITGGILLVFVLLQRALTKRRAR